MSKKFDLEDRLIQFAADIVQLAESLPNSDAGKYLQNQLSRSSISSALNYGEVQAAESRRDFIHKMRICLKELRETKVCLKIIHKKGYSPVDSVQNLLTESDQLVAIFVKSVQTAQNKLSTK